jgi:hypothetical protein
MFLNHDDVIALFLVMIFLPCLAVIITKILNFVPSFMVSLLKSVKNPSLVYSDDYIDSSRIANSRIADSSIANSDFGSKTLVDRVNEK